MQEAFARSELFSHLDAGVQGLLASAMEMVRFQDGQDLLDGENDEKSMYLVLSGQLRIVPNPVNGATVQASVISVGGTYGESTLVTGKRLPARVTAIGETQVARLSLEAFASLSYQNPESGLLITDALCRQQHHAQLALVLHLSQLFCDLDAEVLRDLESELELISLRGGDVLMRQGEEGESLFLVISGCLRVVVQRGEKETVVAEVGRGESIGEMAVISGGPRSATVYSIRDSQLARLSRAGFERLLLKHPAVMTRMLAGRLVARLQQQNNPAQGTRRAATTYAVISVDPNVSLHDFCERLRQAFSTLGKTQRVDSQTVSQTLGSPDIAECGEGSAGYLRLSEWLSLQESENEHVLYEAGVSESLWTQRCIRQADQILIVTGADAPVPSAFRVGSFELSRYSPATDAQRTLVLVHPDDRQRPQNTARWLSLPGFQRHLHVRASRGGDYERLARFVSGRAVGLVFGGGFARGLAHVGVIRAMNELGIPIDAIGGSSMGGIVASLWAMGWDGETIIRRTAESCSNSMNDLTFPFIAFQRGRKFSKVVEDFAGDVRIEDLWIPFFCVSANLNRAELKIHTQGPLVTALLATTRAPGVFPPIVIDGELHVDGGMLNNVPVDVMKNFVQGGPVIGVDVSPPHELNLIEDYGRDVDGWKAFWRRFGKRKEERQYVPSILLVLMRTIEFSGVSFKQVASRKADLYLMPPLLGFKRTDFQLAGQIADVGYRHCMEKVVEWRAKSGGERGKSSHPPAEIFSI